MQAWYRSRLIWAWNCNMFNLVMPQSHKILPIQRLKSFPHTSKQQRTSKQVSAAADRPEQCSTSHLPCCTQISMVSVINYDRWQSPVYHTDRPPKFLAPEMISRSRDMVGAHQNLNGSRDLTTPLKGPFCHPWASIATFDLPTKFEVSISTHYEDMKSDTKCQKMGGSG